MNETMDDVRAKTDAINRAEPIVQREVFELWEATQRLGLMNAALENEMTILRHQLRSWALQMANAAAESSRQETKPERREWHNGCEHMANGLLSWMGDKWPERTTR